MLAGVCFAFCGEALASWLYAAKRFGKNRAMSFDHPDSDPEMFAA